MTVTAAGAERMLAERERGLPDLLRVLDAGEFSTLVGAAARVTGVRYKPGASLTATFLFDEAPTDPRWIAVYADAAKVEKSLREAARAGAEATAVGASAVTGAYRADRVLARPLARIARREPGLLESASVLRHTPHRRVVLRASGRGRDVAVKVSSRSSRPAQAGDGGVGVTAELAARGVPVLPSWRIASSSQAVGTEWWGEGDLAARPDAGVAALAGAATAGLHRTGPWRGVADGPRATPPHRAASAVAVVAPWLAERASSLAGRLAPRLAASRRGGLATVHGDLSPDQVLVGDGEIRLIDFDRVSLDAPARDLGSFAAAHWMLGAPDETLAGFLDGYRASGGRVDDDEVDAWLAHALLCRATQPFRQRDPHWPRRIAAILDAAEQRVTT